MKSYPMMLGMFFFALIVASVNISKAEYGWTTWFIGIALLTLVWIGVALFKGVK